MQRYKRNGKQHCFETEKIFCVTMVFAKTGDFTDEIACFNNGKYLF